MYYADLSKYSYTEMTSRASLVNVGWLDFDVPFQLGKAPSEFIEKVTLATRLLRNPMRGIHGCRACGGLEDIYELVDGERFLLGMSETWLPASTSETIYIAPSLLLHYLTRHEYLPPAEVVRDVLALPCEPDEWDTPNGSYRKLVARYGD
ncbi:MAG TPA: hypothetical protein VM869_22750 [Enhygromyxa sp.]|nr:hypothetical protein [Enhygromyxa sp.]